MLQLSRRARRSVRAWGKRAAHRLYAMRYGRPSGLASVAGPEIAHAGIASQPVPATAFRCFGANTAELGLTEARYPAMRVIDLAGGSVLGPRGWIFTQAADVLPECSWYGDALRLDQIPGSFGPAVRLRGTCLSLASDFAVGSYGHFLLDCLPRLGIVEAAGIALDSIDHFYLPRPPGHTARLLLQRLGIAEGRCVWADRPCRVQPDRLLATSFPGRRRDYPPSTAAFLRSIRPPPSGGGRRLFGPRHGKRQIVNEAALWAIAEHHGFELYDFSREADEPGVFAQAETVVGAHGSGLANIAFCRPGTQILELIPSDHVHPYYASLARAAGLEYSYIVGDSVRLRPPGSWGPSHYPFAVDPGVFEQALQALVAMSSKS